MRGNQLEVECRCFDCLLLITCQAGQAVVESIRDAEVRRGSDYGLGTYAATAANCWARIFLEGLSSGQPVTCAWFGFSGIGAGCTDKPTDAILRTATSARPIRSASRSAATISPISQILDSLRPICRVIDSWRSLGGMKASG